MTTRAHGTGPASGCAGEQNSMNMRVNISRAERWASTMGGALLGAAAIKRFIEDKRTQASMLTATAAGLILRGTTGHSHLYEALGLNTTGTSDTRVRLGGKRGIHVEEAVTINASTTQLYCLWRDFEYLPFVIPGLVTVQPLGRRRSRWIARGPGGRNVTWTAEIINEIPGELIAWKTVGPTEVVSAGSVHFTPAPGTFGSIMRVRMQYDTAGGKLGAVIAGIFGHDPAERVREGLGRFKRMIETGEIAGEEPALRGIR